VIRAVIRAAGPYPWSICYRQTRPTCDPGAGDDAAEVSWFPPDDLSELTFDHAKVLAPARAA
jgi:hypothetical protein